MYMENLLVKKLLKRKVNVIEEIVNRLQQENKFILFGAGIGGITTYQFISRYITNGQEKVKYFMDNNMEKEGTKLFFEKRGGG